MSALSLKGFLGRDQAGELAEVLRQELQAGQPLTLDASSLTGIDGSGLQLLLALARDARETGLPLRWESPAEPLQEAAALLGITGELDL